MSSRPVGLLVLAIAAVLGCSDSQGPGDESARVKYTAITAGYGFTCAISEAGDTYCWGRANFLSDSVPALLTSPEPLIQISASNGYGSGGFCGSTADNRVFCWGSYYYGHDQVNRFGNGVDPVEINGSAGLLAIAAGRGHFCGIAADSTASCWGSYISGKRGSKRPGSDLADLTPFPVTGGLAFKQLALGDEYSCGLRGDGQVACWGDSVLAGNPGAAYEHLDNPCWLVAACTETPVTVVGVMGASKVAAGGDYACALGSNGVRCWGSNYFYDFGATAPNSTPTLVDLAVPVVDIGIGSGLSCALSTDGAAYCWGNLSIDPSGPPETTATPVKYQVGRQRFTALSVGTRHACAITESKAIYCWGEAGGLGDGTGKPSAIPVRVVEPR